MIIPAPFKMETLPGRSDNLIFLVLRVAFCITCVPPCSDEINIASTICQYYSLSSKNCSGDNFSSYDDYSYCCGKNLYYCCNWHCHNITSLLRL